MGSGSAVRAERFNRISTTEETKEEPSRPGVKRRCQEFGKNQHVENLKEDLRRHSTSPDILRQARAVAHSHPRHFLTCQGLLVASSVLATRMSSGHITQPYLEDVKTMLLIYRLSPLAQECAHADSITVLVGSLDIVETWLGHGCQAKHDILVTVTYIS